MNNCWIICVVSNNQTSSLLNFDQDKINIQNHVQECTELVWYIWDAKSSSKPKSVKNTCSLGGYWDYYYVAVSKTVKSALIRC